MHVFPQAASREEEDQSRMTVEVYKAQIADLSRKAAALEKVFKHYRCPAKNKANHHCMTRMVTCSISWST